jgi:20S proteasome subunit alpha 7
VNKARSEANSYRSFYGSNIPGGHLTEQISSHVHLYTIYSGLRPFGASVLVATYDHEKPELFMIDPSGTSFSYYACAVGKGKQVAKTELEKLEPNKLTCLEAAKEIARIIHTVHDKTKDKEMMLEMSWIGKHTNGKHVPLPKDVYEQIDSDDEDIKED